NKDRESKSDDKRSEMLLADPEIRIAKDLVLWAPAKDRAQMLAQMSEFVAQQAEVEEQRIAAALAKRSIDWSRDPAPAPTPGAKLRVLVKSDKPGNVIKGGEQGRLTVTVTNVGTSPAYQVRAITDSDYRYFDEREFLFGRIDPGASKEFSVKLSVSEHELSRTDRIDVHVFEQHDAPVAEGSVTSLDLSAEGLP